MALIWCFDCGARHSTSQLQSGRGWDAVYGNAGVSVAANRGRGWNTPVIRLDGGSSNPAGLMRLLSSTFVDEVRLFVRLGGWNRGGATPTPGLSPAIAFLSPGGMYIFGLFWTVARGALDLRVGASQTNNDVSNQVSAGLVSVTDSRQQVIEMKARYSTGELTVRVDGTTVYDGHPGFLGGLQGFRSFLIQGPKALREMIPEFQDIMLFNSDGDAPNSWLGPGFYIHTDFPTGDGNVANWTPDSGGTMWERVDELNSDDGGSYIESQNVGDIAQFTYPPLPVEIYQVIGVVGAPVCQPVSLTGQPTLKARVRSLGTNYTVGKETLVPANWNDANLDCVAIDPGTGLPWASRPAVDACEFGFIHNT